MVDDIILAKPLGNFVSSAVDQRDAILAVAVAVFAAGMAGLTAALSSPEMKHYKTLIRSGGVAVFVSVAGFGLLLFSNKDSDVQNAVPTVMGTGTTVTSIGQSGGVTTGTYVNQAVLPVLRILGSTQKRNWDGTTTVTINTLVEAPVTPSSLHIGIEAPGLLSANILTPPVNGDSRFEMRNYHEDKNSFGADIPEPSGIYSIVVQTQNPTTIGLDSHF